MGVAVASVCILLHSTMKQQMLSVRTQILLQIFFFTAGAVEMAGTSCSQCGYLQHLALCSCFWLFVPEASGWTILSIQALETAAAMIFIVASGRPHMLLSLASHVLVSMFAPAWLVLSAEANAKDLEQKLQGASTLSSRSPSSTGQTPESELSLWLHAATCSLSDRVLQPAKAAMSRSKSLTICEGTGAASDTTLHSDTWRSHTAPPEFLAGQDHPQRRQHQLYGKSRQPGKSDSFTSLQSTEQSSVIGSVAWSQIDIEERGTVSEGLETSVSRPQPSASNSVSLAYTKEVHHLLWLASQASESRGAPPAIAAHLAVIAVSASQAAGMNLSQAALDVHTLWLQSLSGFLTTKRGLLHSKMLHTTTQSARTSSSQPRTSTSTTSHFEPPISAMTSSAILTASASAKDSDGLKVHEDPRPTSGSETGPSTADLLGSVARTLDDSGCLPWQTFDPAAQDTYGAHSSTSIPDRARRLLELSTICEGSEPSTAERGTWPMRGIQHLQTPLAPSAFSSDEDEQPHPIAASVAEAEPKYQQQVRSISSLALRMSDAQQPLQSFTTVSRTEVWAAAAGALNRKLAASAFGETMPRTLGADHNSSSGFPHSRNNQIHSWKCFTLLYKSVPGRGPASIPGTDTSSEEAQPRQPVSGWLAARRRRLQRSVSMSALALEQDRHLHVKQASSSTSPQLPPLSTRSKLSADGTTRASDLSSSRVHSNTSASRVPIRQQGYAAVQRSTRASASQVDPLSSSSYPSQVGCTPLISPRYSNTSVAKRMGHTSSSLDNNDNSSHVLALQAALDTLRGNQPMTQPPSISQPVLSNLQLSSLRELSGWPHSEPHSGSRGLLSESAEFLMAGTQGPHWRTHVRRASSLPLQHPYAEESAVAFASARARQERNWPGLNHQQPGSESQQSKLPVIQDPALQPKHLHRFSSHSAIGPVAHEKVSRFAGGRDLVTRSTSIDAHTLDSTSTNASSQHPQGLGLASSCISSPQQPLTTDSQPSFVPHQRLSNASSSVCAGTEVNSSNPVGGSQHLHGHQGGQASPEGMQGIALPPLGPLVLDDISSALTSAQVAHHNLPHANTRDRSISLSHHAHAFERPPTQTPIPPTRHSPRARKDAACAHFDLHLHSEASTSDSSSSGSRTPLPATRAARQPSADPRTAGHRLKQPSTRAASFCFDARAEPGEDDEFVAAASPPSYFHNSAPQHLLSASPGTFTVAVPPPSSPHNSLEAQSMLAACSHQVSVAAPICSQRSSASTGSGSRSPGNSSAMHIHDALEQRQSSPPSLIPTSISQVLPTDSGPGRITPPPSHFSPRKVPKGVRGGAPSDEGSGQHRFSVGNPDMVRHSNTSNLRSTDSLTSSGIDKDGRLEMFSVGGMSVTSCGDGTGKRRSAPYVPPSYHLEPQMQTDLGLSGGKWEAGGSILAGHSAQSAMSLLISGRNTGRATKEMGSSSRLSNLDVNSWAGTCAPKAVGGVTQVFGIETGQASRQLGVGTLQVEAEIEDCIIANRRLLDERRVLLDEVNIDKILGFGSMGIVYFGQLFDTKVVIKLIEHGTGVLGKEQNRGRLARVEAVISRLLLHPNIVTTYDCCTGPINSSRLANLAVGKKQGHGRNAAGRERCMTVIVQEFCVLGTLKDALLRKKAGLDPADAAFLPAVMHLALGIANGMKHLASLRIMHADLKAENVLLQKVEKTQENPLGLLAKVADFGLAQILPLNGQIKAGIHGTVSHMPPEAMKETIFSLATDVFSFGVVLWEMVTQEAPYRGMLPHEVVEAVCESKKRLVWPPNIFPCLKELAEDCWQEEPHSRPSFHQIVERLRVMVLRNTGITDRHSNITTCSEESDELEAALRAQKRTAGVQPTLRAIESGESDADTSTQQVGSHQGPETVASVMAQGFPGDPLGRILYLLCQMPPPHIHPTVDLGVIVEQQGQLPGSSIWVTESEKYTA